MCDLKNSVEKRMQIASTIMVESVWDMLINSDREEKYINKTK